MKKTLIILFILSLFILSACATTNTQKQNMNEDGLTDKDMNSIELSSDEMTQWLNYDLTDVNTGKSFQISNYKDKNIVLLETFAVWCVNCKQQQDQIKEFHKTNPDIISISVNADPNDSEETVKEYTSKHGYDWKYVVAPQSFMNLLLDEFGIVIANAPAAPIVLICEDQSYALLPRGIKTAKELSEDVEMSC